MSEQQERGRYYGRKKFQKGESSGYGRSFFNSSNKGAIPRGDLNEHYREKDEKKETKDPPMKQPTILLKTRDKDDSRSVSPKRQSKDGKESVPPITIATPSSENKQAPHQVKIMHKSVKLIEDGNIFTEHLQDYLEENNDFLVVGVMGPQGVGKSTIMNLLAHKDFTAQLKKTIFDNPKQESEPGSEENIHNLTDTMAGLKIGSGNGNQEAKKTADVWQTSKVMQSSEDIQNSNEKKSQESWQEPGVEITEGWQRLDDVHSSTVWHGLECVHSSEMWQRVDDTHSTEGWQGFEEAHSSKNWQALEGAHSSELWQTPGIREAEGWKISEGNEEHSWKMVEKSQSPEGKITTDENCDVPRDSEENEDKNILTKFTEREKTIEQKQILEEKQVIEGKQFTEENQHTKGILQAAEGVHISEAEKHQTIEKNQILEKHQLTEITKNKQITGGIDTNTGKQCTEITHSKEKQITGETLQYQKSKELQSEEVVEEKLEKCTLIFEQQSLYTLENDFNTTTGIDLFISESRIMFLDCQPFLSPSMLDELMRSENKRSNIINEFLPMENTAEMQALQLTSFLMSVCHVVILVQNWFFDSNVIRFVLAAEMLKPTISTPEDELVDYFPHLLLLHNKAQMEDFNPSRFKLMQDFYRIAFGKTKMHLQSFLGMGTGYLIPNLSPKTSGEPINLFLLPEYDESTRDIFSGHPPIDDIILRLKMNVFGCTKYPLTHMNLSEKNWIAYCSKVWDYVKKSSFFMEYAKLLP